MNKELLLRCQGEDYLHSINFALVSRDYTSVGTSVIMEEQDEHAAIKPTFTLNLAAAKVLMDDMWNSGIRPTDWANKQKSDQDKHLADMRLIAGKFLELEF